MVSLISSRFLGIVPVYLRTYTTTYAPLSGSTWNLHPNSLVPMEFEGYRDTNFNALGFKARLIDLATGYSTLTVGDTSGILDTDTFGPGAYDPVTQQICGFGVGALVLTLFPTLWQYNLPWDGQTRVLPTFQPGAANISFVGNNNKGLPSPGCGINWLTSGGSIYSSSEDALVNSSQLWGRGGGAFGGGIAHTLFSVNGLNFPTNARHGGSIPGIGVDYILAGNGTGGNNPWNISVTNYANATTFVLVNNPTQPASSTVDFSTFLIDSANQGYSANKNYWMQAFSSIQTFNGITMNGWGLRVAPDFSTYEILNIIPMDAGAADWNNQPSAGGAVFKTDRAGNIWVKNANRQARLLVGGFAPSDQAIVPQLPLTSLPVNPGLYR